MYGDDRRVWNRLLEMVSEDFVAMQRDGITLGLDGKCWPIVIGTKGDWSYLVPRP